MGVAAREVLAPNTPESVNEYIEMKESKEMGDRNVIILESSPLKRHTGGETAEGNGERWLSKSLMEESGKKAQSTEWGDGIENKRRKLMKGVSRQATGTNIDKNSGGGNSYKYSKNGSGRKEQYIEESEDEDSDREYKARESLVDADKLTLQFFNKATEQELVMQTIATEHERQEIMKLRPFRNYNALEETIRKTKGLRVSVVTQYYDMVIGLAEIDNVIEKCSVVARRLKDVLENEGINTNEDSGKYEGLKAGVQLKQSETLNAEYSLKPFQLEGVAWLGSLYKAKASGILADEMGLGKTFQVISFLTGLKDQGISGPHLIICPTSTLDNWLLEIKKFSPSLKVRSYYGNQMERRRMGLKIEKYGADFDILLSTYNVATSNKTDRALLRRISFKTMILDEGHMVKNCTSVRYCYLQQIRAPFRLLLTGTPLQNNLQELVSLLAFVMPKIFDDCIGALQLAFKNKGGATKKDDSSGNVQLDEGSTVESSVPESLLPIEHKHILKAQKLLAPFVLRRRKSDVLKDLPAKTQQTIKVEMTEYQRSLYEKHINMYGFDKQKEEDVLALSPSSADGNEAKTSQSWTAKMMNLRKIANHPLLVRSHFDDSKLAKMASLILTEPDYKESIYEYVYQDMQLCSDFELDYYCRKYLSLAPYKLPTHLLYDSAKVVQLESILSTNIRDLNQKVLIFSQFTSMLDILETVLKSWNYLYVRLDGSTKTTERQQLIDSFNNSSSSDGISIFLLSTKAGGFGINLATANIVVIHDIDLNPHNDKQAEDRAHRVGQSKPVTVLKLIANSTVEQTILDLANSKLLLDKNVANY
ncbi:ATP-dependent helicase fft2 [Zancudomyces culisetae]|uniref:ATP-dependent helicase fft2 n=1 Tax=Zancudomyces culisetae TaxID=1213189 RepID=A0A1R1PIL5_ZANCU|nr:ATP-dependent helicase fft2 [Zancudomyces culisetae]|eukprot:OMH80692.1 ATP-dependent helicase fft2 [Zancudomyces culisetae]